MTEMRQCISCGDPFEAPVQSPFKYCPDCFQFYSIQDQMYEWQQETYPQSDVWTDIAGIAEEFGELAQVQIDKHVGREPRDDFNTNEEAMKDAVGDMMVYLGNFAAKHELNLLDCYQYAAEEVTDDESRHG